MFLISFEILDFYFRFGFQREILLLAIDEFVRCKML